MSEYRARIGADRIAFLVEHGGTLGPIADHVASAEDSPDEDTMVFDGRAMAALRDLPADSDGHVDDNRQMWFGGVPYDVEVVAHQS